MKKIIAALLLMSGSFYAFAQTEKDNNSLPSEKKKKKTEIIETNYLYQRSGKFFLFWGYNRSTYSHTNMHFKGDGYDFKINYISATDDASNLNSDYVNPTKFTNPQYNYRIGYFLSDKNFISVGMDHMRYTMAKQTTHLTGSITKGNNIGEYHNTEVVVGEDCEINNNGPSYIDNLPKGFVSNFEHCDGLNDFSVEFGRLQQLWISKNHKHALAVTGAAGIGMLIPDSDADILGQPPKHDMDANKKAYHLAGYSFTANMGFQLDLFRHVFILARLKAGYINLPDINTTIYGGKASQHFTFIEPMGVIGYTFHI